MWVRANRTVGVQSNRGCSATLVKKVVAYPVNREDRSSGVATDCGVQSKKVRVDLCGIGGLERVVSSSSVDGIEPPESQGQDFGDGHLHRGDTLPVCQAQGQSSGFEGHDDD
jgi:hypothetical protein